MKKLFEKKKESIMFGMLGLLIIFGLLFYKNFIYLDYSEKTVKNDCQHLHDMMKDEDSFTLEDDITLITYNDDEEIHYFTYIPYSAKNGFGARTKGYAVYSSYKYLGDLDEDVDMEELIECGKGSDLHKLLLGKLAYQTMLVEPTSDKLLDYYTVDKDKISWRIK